MGRIAYLISLTYLLLVCVVTGHAGDSSAARTFETRSTGRNRIAGHTADRPRGNLERLPPPDVSVPPTVPPPIWHPDTAPHVKLRAVRRSSMAFEPPNHQPDMKTAEPIWLGERRQPNRQFAVPQAVQLEDSKPNETGENVSRVNFVRVVGATDEEASGTKTDVFPTWSETRPPSVSEETVASPQSFPQLIAESRPEPVLEDQSSRRTHSGSQANADTESKDRNAPDGNTSTWLRQMADRAGRLIHRDSSRR